MPRPEVRPPVSRRALLALACALLALVVAGLAVSCSMTDDTGQDQEGTSAQQPSDDAGREEGSPSTKEAKVGGMSKLAFLGDEGKAAFVQALRKYLTENDIDWPSGAKVKRVANRTDTTARVFVRLDGGAWLVCYWVKDTSTPFLFEASTKDEATSADGSADDAAQGSEEESGGQDADPVTGDTTNGNVADDTGTSGQTSTAAGVAASRQTSSEATGGAGSSGSSSKASTSKTKKADSRRRDAAKTPVVASDAEGLDGKLPEEAALTLPTAITNYMSKHGTKVDGRTATIDLASVRKSGKVTTFYGYVTDGKGRVHYLDGEWNADKRRFGMATYR